MHPDIVYVTNNNEFPHADRYDGVDYFFQPKEKVQLPVLAAEHMFGLGRADKTETLVRIGWATRFNPETKRQEEDPTGVQRLARFVFTKAVMIEEQVNTLDDFSGKKDGKKVNA